MMTTKRRRLVLSTLASDRYVDFDGKDLKLGDIYNATSYMMNETDEYVFVYLGSNRDFFNLDGNMQRTILVNIEDDNVYKMNKSLAAYPTQQEKIILGSRFDNHYVVDMDGIYETFGLFLKMESLQQLGQRELSVTLYRGQSSTNFTTSNSKDGSPFSATITKFTVGDVIDVIEDRYPDFLQIGKEYVIIPTGNTNFFDLAEGQANVVLYRIPHHHFVANASSKRTVLFGSDKIQNYASKELQDDYRNNQKYIYTDKIFHVVVMELDVYEAVMERLQTKLES